MPTDALTGEGRARERALIEHLGREYFFDHERQLKATRRPELPLDVEAAWREYDQPKYEEKYGKRSPQVEIQLKVDEIRRWEERHLDGEHPELRFGRMADWAREHRNDPDFTRVTPEQVFEAVRAQQPLSG